MNNTDPDALEPPLVEGDIAVRTDGKNADPCTARGCLWNKWSDGKVYIPYYIANHYGKDQVILKITETQTNIPAGSHNPQSK